MTGETFRGAIHDVSALLAFSVALYNLMRFTETKRPRNALNALCSLAYCALELQNAKEHIPRSGMNLPTPDLDPALHLGIGA